MIISTDVKGAMDKIRHPLFMNKLGTLLYGTPTATTLFRGGTI